MLVYFAGVIDKLKPVGSKSNVICPVCGRLTIFEIRKYYTYLHFFFIPLFQWNVRYCVKTTCGCECELKKDIGVRIEKGEDVKLSQNDFLGTQYVRICNQCGAKMDNNFDFCPYCGEKL